MTQSHGDEAAVYKSSLLLTYLLSVSKRDENFFCHLVVNIIWNSLPDNVVQARNVFVLLIYLNFVICNWEFLYSCNNLDLN